MLIGKKEIYVLTIGHGKEAYEEWISVLPIAASDDVAFHSSGVLIDTN